MAQPVWVLSVDLQTKTATFQSGMADAAKAARGSFNDIKQGAGDMARNTSTNMTPCRASIMFDPVSRPISAAPVFMSPNAPLADFAASAIPD